MTKDPVALYLLRDFRREIDDVRYAELQGFDEIWVADGITERDSITLIAALAATTEKVVLGVGVAPMWGRNPGILAVTAGALWEIAPGRIKFGLGAWWEPIASQMGIHRRKNLRVMREIITNMRRLLNLETVTFEGEHVKFKDLKMTFVSKPPEKRPVPLYVGATGFKMCEVTGEIADGICMNYLVPPSYIKKCVEHLRIGAERARRNFSDLDRPQLIAISLSEDRDKALDAGRVMLAEYLCREPHIMKASGVSEEILDELHQKIQYPFTHEELVKASVLVPDEAVQSVMAAGTPKECRYKVREFVKAGTTMPILSPVLKNAKEVIDEFIGGYM